MFHAMAGICSRWRQRRLVRARSGLRDVEFIMSEVRRARRFDLPFSVALYLEPSLPSGFALRELAQRLDAELREFDYVAVNEARSFIALWMFGTPRNGALIKAERLPRTPALADVLGGSPCGVATFPADGMTYDALMEFARQDALRVGPRPIELHVRKQEKERWSPSRPSQATESTSTS